MILIKQKPTYVRTKDGKILDLDRIELYAEYYCIDNENQLYIEWYAVKETFEILKQADTIKELCDGFIITSKQGHIYDSYGCYTYELEEILPQAREECPDEDWDLYGCILVNGIIKQVAKLNDEKGNLELL